MVVFVSCAFAHPLAYIVTVGFGSVPPADSGVSCVPQTPQAIFSESCGCARAGQIARREMRRDRVVRASGEVLATFL
jgi:hypothetical protein